jgi:hypothetical protein
MANEAVLVFETEKPIPFTCADGTGIEKGALLKISDPFTVAVADGASNAVGGIAAEEKIASDGKTKIGVYRGGIFKVVASGPVTVGKAVYIKGSANLVYTGAVNDESALGIALETAAEAETFLMELRPTSMELA